MYTEVIRALLLKTDEPAARNKADEPMLTVFLFLAPHAS